MITTTQDSNGYYLGTDGERYAKVSANPYDSSYTFSDGTTIVSGTNYYFKVEPIKWRILKTENGKALLFCEEIIDAHRFNYTSSDRTINGSTIHANNYKYSDIRAWLNGYSQEEGNVSGEDWSTGGFLQTAFTEEEQNLILMNEVDNSASTTESLTNSYACENTYDKIFLLSYQDMINTKYGFDSSSSNVDIARRKKTTDYSRVNKIYYNTTVDYLYNGYYWLRSPSSSPKMTNTLDYNGYSGHSYFVYYNIIGVAPALWLNIGTGETVSNVSDSGSGETKSENIVEKTTKNSFLNFDSMIAFMSVLCVDAILVQNPSNTNEMIFNDKRKRKHKNV